jgi:hypothetical protein
MTAATDRRFDAITAATFPNFSQRFRRRINRRAATAEPTDDDAIRPLAKLFHALFACPYALTGKERSARAIPLTHYLEWAALAPEQLRITVLSSIRLVNKSLI